MVTAWLGASLGASAVVGCRTETALCRVSAQCGTGRACVAGRCQPDDADAGVRVGLRASATVRPRPEIQDARRLALRADDIRTSDGRRSGSVSLHPAAPLSVRFTLPDVAWLRSAWPRDAGRVVEAYVLLHRAPIGRHDAMRLTGALTAASVHKGATQQDFSAMSAGAFTQVDPQSPSWVRVDVREAMATVMRAEIPPVVDEEDAYGPQNARVRSNAAPTLGWVSFRLDSELTEEGTGFASFEIDALGPDAPVLEVYLRN